jgi:hypothetical protein
MLTYITSSRPGIFGKANMHQQKSCIELGFTQVARLIGIAILVGPVDQSFKRLAAGQKVAYVA